MAVGTDNLVINCYVNSCNHTWNLQFKLGHLIWNVTQKVLRRFSGELWKWWKATKSWVTQKDISDWRHVSKTKSPNFTKFFGAYCLWLSKSALGIPACFKSKSKKSQCIPMRTQNARKNALKSMSELKNTVLLKCKVLLISISTRFLEASPAL